MQMPPPRTHGTSREKSTFGPGGRLKGPEFEGEERILEDLEETLTEERLHKMLAAVTSDRAG